MVECPRADHDTLRSLYCPPTSPSVNVRDPVGKARKQSQMARLPSEGHEESKWRPVCSVQEKFIKHSPGAAKRIISITVSTHTFCSSIICSWFVYSF